MDRKLNLLAMVLFSRLKIDLVCQTAYKQAENNSDLMQQQSVVFVKPKVLKKHII